jgi:DNA-binding transcriptional LysR family regulator
LRYIVNRINLLCVIQITNIDNLDLNLLRLFDAIYRTNSVSRAAEELGLSQPATSQALARLRRHLHDPLFVRTAGGVRPTARAMRLARSVGAGLALLDAGVNEGRAFDPATSTAEIQLHLTDLGERRFLPPLMVRLAQVAPNLQIRSRAWPHDEIVEALESGQLHFAFGFLPGVAATNHVELLADRYQVLVRIDHPVLVHARAGMLDTASMSMLDFVTVRSHAETDRILQLLNPEPRVRLVTANFVALPAIIRTTNLAAFLPLRVGSVLEPREAFTLLEPDLPHSDFSVALHWSPRHAHIPVMRWFRQTLLELFQHADPWPHGLAGS